MRIAVVFRDPPPQSDRDGALRLRRVARGLSDRGHDVTVYCQGWWQAAGRRIEVDGLEHEAVTFDAGRLFFSRLPGVLARRGPDVILASVSPPGAVVAARLGGLFARVPVVCEWFGDEPALRESRWLEAAADWPTAVVTPSKLRRTRVRELGAAAEATAVIPEGIDFPAIRAADPGERRELVYAHDLDETANLESLLLALAELRDRASWTATVIGDGPKRADYERQARDLRIRDRIEFVGEVDRSERLSVYRSAHAFVQTARREHFATELLWALACGCVGVVEYQGRSGAHELVERRERGIRVTDMEALDEAIEDAWAQEFRDIDESFQSFDHVAVTGDYIELFRDCGVDAR